MEIVINKSKIYGEEKEILRNKYDLSEFNIDIIKFILSDENEKSEMSN